MDKIDIALQADGNKAYAIKKNENTGFFIRRGEGRDTEWRCLGGFQCLCEGKICRTFSFLFSKFVKQG